MRLLPMSCLAVLAATELLNLEKQKMNGANNDKKNNTGF